MKAIFVSLFILFSLFLSQPNRVLAASCSSLGGHCTILQCAGGAATLAGGDCILSWCCPPANAPGVPYPGDLRCNINNTGINTALGCIDTDMSSGGFIKSILTLAVGLGGGIALLMMLYGTFIVTTSAGIPDKLNQGKEIITSAATGLIFIILSIVLMNLIGVSVLGIPGL